MSFDPQVAQHIQSLGYNFIPDLSKPASVWHQVDEGRDGLKGAWIYNLHTLKDQTQVLIFTIYDYRTGAYETEKFSPRDMTAGERKAIDAKIELHRQKAEEEKKRKWEECKAFCAEKWASAKILDTGGHHPYLNRKGHVPASVEWGLRTHTNAFGKTDLLIPMLDVFGVLWGFQLIHEDGTKEFIAGQRLDSVFYCVGGSDSGRIYVCEGAATALSIAESIDFKYPVFAAFNAGNMMKVTRALREKYERAPIIVCADNDKWKPGVGNTGVRSAEEIISAIDGTACAIPDFSGLDEASKPTDFNDLKNLAGRAEVRSQLEKVKINRPHILFSLGHNQGSYYFTTTKNPQIQHIREFSQTEFVRLRPRKYWALKYGAPSGAIDWLTAKDDLIRQSEERGIFDPERVRGVGLYFEGDQLAYHLGDRLYFESGETKDLSDLESENIYEPKPKLKLPEKVNLPDMVRARRAVEMFSWSHPFEAKLAMGWNVVAPMAGILEWRPHVSIQAPRGKGKSTVLRYVGQPCQKYLNGRRLEGMTEAGLRQVIKTDTSAVMLDEVDANSLDEKSFQRIVTLLRLCSSGGEITRGTPSGKALRFKANFSAMLVGINMPAMQEVDRSRIAELELLAEHKEKNWDKMRKELDQALSDTFSAGFFWLVFARARAVMKSAATLHTVISKYDESRVGQQYGTLLAGFWHWENAEQIPLAEAERLVAELFSWQKDKRGGDDKVENDAESCLHHLYSMPIKITDTRDVLTLGALIGLDISLEEKNNALESFGLKAIVGKGLFVSNHNPSLKRYFTGTAWPDWTRSLKRLPNVAQDRVVVGISRPRGIFLPLEIKRAEV